MEFFELELVVELDLNGAFKNNSGDRKQTIKTAPTIIGERTGDKQPLFFSMIENNYSTRPAKSDQVTSPLILNED